MPISSCILRCAKLKRAVWCYKTRDQFAGVQDLPISNSLHLTPSLPRTSSIHGGIVTRIARPDEDGHHYHCAMKAPYIHCNNVGHAVLGQFCNLILKKTFSARNSVRKVESLLAPGVG